MEMAKKKTKIVMSMNTKSNKHLPTSKHIVGKKGKGKKSAEKAAVRKKVHAKYPSIGAGKVNKSGNKNNRKRVSAKA
ncbi:unnamed protein product [Sphagnum jensenii]